MAGRTATADDQRAPGGTSQTTKATDGTTQGRLGLSNMNEIVWNGALAEPCNVFAKAEI